ncbi:MAG: hypothetical protein NC397_01125 [Clostridium sp.]|nr:hypothetical protein [Clostridium sp.]
MLREVLEKEKVVCLYLSKEERDDTEFRESLKPYYKKCKAAGYKVAVLLSGEEDLVENTIRLLKYNRELSARNEVRTEMAQAEKLKKRREREYER